MNIVIYLTYTAATVMVLFWKSVDMTRLKQDVADAIDLPQEVVGFSWSGYKKDQVFKTTLCIFQLLYFLPLYIRNDNFEIQNKF